MASTLGAGSVQKSAQGWGISEDDFCICAKKLG